jgi:hypothetical protein
MGENKNKAKVVLIFGVVGILGVVFTIISDLILLGRPESGYSFLLLPTECMAWIPGWRITIGTFLGVFMLPFQIAGLVPLYFGLKPSGRTVPVLAGIVGAHGLIMGVAFHTTYAFLAGGWKLLYSVGHDDSGVSVLMRDFEFFWKLLIVIMVVELTLLSVIYIVSVLKGNSLYPKWMAIFNPLLIMAVIILVLLAIPAPVGGYAAPTMLNLSTLTFFIISTTVVWKKLNETVDVLPLQ